jgi:hypothetical protein
VKFVGWRVGFNVGKSDLPDINQLNVINSLDLICRVCRVVYSRREPRRNRDCAIDLRESMLEPANCFLILDLNDAWNRR